jgi:hypothetical protein
MSLRKRRLAGRDLLWIVGTPDCGTPCMDCHDHPARVQVMRRTRRDSSAYAIKSYPLLHLCETCAMRFVEMVVGMLAHMTHNRVDDELSLTTADHAKIARSTGQATRHDRRVRARVRRLKRDEEKRPARRA